MDIFVIFLAIGFAGLIHASFQLSISMVTLLSGHTNVKKMNTRKTFSLIDSFIWGVVIMTTLILSTSSFLISIFFPNSIPLYIWALATIFMIFIGVIIWSFYYRRGEGTALWMPRSLARFIDKRINKVQIPAEAFSLGVSSVLTEIMFIAGPTLAVSLLVNKLPTNLQIYALMLYVFIASSGVFLTRVLIGSGHSISKIQKWREENKLFMQFCSGSALIVLGVFLYVNIVLPSSIINIGGL